MYRFVFSKSTKNLAQRALPIPSRKYSGHGHPRQAGFGKVLIILAPIATVGGIITYAKYDNEFRKTLVKNVPAAEPVLNIFLQEDSPLDGISKKFDNISSSITGLFGGKTDADEKTAPPSKKVEKPDAKPAPAAAKPKPAASPAQKPTEEKSATKSAPVSIAKKPDTIPTEITELEKAVEASAALAIQEFSRAIKILQNYNEDIKKVVDQAIEKLDLTSWMTLKNKTNARDTSVDTAENSARDAMNKIDRCEMALSKIAGDVSHDQLQALRHKIRTMRDHLNGAKDELYKVKDSASLSEKYWKKVESARNHFVDEIESIFPGLNLADKKLNLSKDDLDLFIMHAYSYVLAYQKELQRLQLDGEQRLKHAIDALRGEDQTSAVNAQLDYHLDKERTKLALENQKKISKIRADSERELRQQLKRVAESHVDHLHDALAQKETELRRIFVRELDEKISTEKAAYKLQLASMLGKLKGMDNALKARAESERCAHQAQALWAACQALWASVRTGEPGVHWQKKLRPLKSEIKAVGKAAAQGDELVAVVLDNLPKEAQERGVYPEDALRERFMTVEKVARKVALVPEEGARLPVYLLSYIQSILIMRPEEAISQEEIQNKSIDFSKLDTYDVLNRARYFLDRGDLTQALKYMNLLQGAPRKVASDWLKEARLLLETQQAANTLMAHAAASGLLYL